MAWSEQQQAMLRAMGHRVWTPSSEAAAALVTPVDSRLLAKPLAPLAPAAPATPVATVATAATVTSTTPAQRPNSPATAAPPRQAAASASPDPTRSAHISALPWPALREAAQSCTACALCQGRKQAVFGVGHERAQWLVVGEAPGEDEDDQGEPFVGASGQLLDNMLRALSLTRAVDGPQTPAQRAYIVNTLQCRPPRNRNPEPSELASCEPFLQRQIALVQPRIILAMGRFAVHALLRSNEPLGKLRGRVHQAQGVPVIVTYHPAYLLRNLTEKAKAWDDLCLAASTFEATFEATFETTAPRP
jgi:uracil-DNA glycosylase